MHPQSTPLPLEPTEPEEWRPVVGYESWYSVSSLGRVRRDRGGPGARAGRILKSTAPSGSGYLQVALSREPGSGQRAWSIHTLVATAFLGSRPDGCGINHINGTKTDNRACNLEWATPKQNSAHAIAHGLMPSGDRSSARLHPESYRGENNGAHRHPEKMARGSENGWAKLTEEDVAQILVSTESQPTLARRYGVTQTTISKILRRAQWLHVPAPNDLASRNVERLHAPRATRGQRNAAAKLTEEAVKDIRSSPLTGAALAAKYGVGNSTISRIRRGTHWRHVAE